MKPLARWMSLVVCLALAVVWSATGQGQKTPADKGYLEPRYPFEVVKPITSVEEIMPNARALVRNRAGFQGLGLGTVQKGETVLIVTSSFADDLVVEAVRRALEERGVKVQILADHKLVNVNRQDVIALGQRQSPGAENGYMEASTFWINGGWRDADRPAAKAWLKSQRPDLYDRLYPKGKDLPANLEAVRRKMTAMSVGPAIAKYLKSHPEVNKVFWGQGGTSTLRRFVDPYQKKYAGAFAQQDRESLMSKIPSYPADVWLLSEQRVMDPIAYGDRVHVTDPEGTDISWDVSELQAQRWAQGVYQRGHIYLHPSQASARYGYSVVNYPDVTEWVPRIPMALTNGVIAGTNGHGGYFPHMAIHYKNGYIVGVDGGGNYGEMLRTYLQYPHINELTYPFHEGSPGYWYHYEVALGTNPKAFRDPRNFYGKVPGTGLGPERIRAGVFHFGQGLELKAEPNTQGPTVHWDAWVDEHKMPVGHGFHIHNYFVTYQIHLRNTDRWVALVDRGRVTSLDDPEVRALASRYGDADTILAYDWNPDIPGINAPGRYDDYSKDPWPYQKATMDKVMAGNYDHYYPAKR